nr:MAG TPA: hypothetical protein [Caudoviricetes sp.]
MAAAAANMPPGAADSWGLPGQDRAVVPDGPHTMLSC